MKRLISLWLCAVMTLGTTAITAHAAPQWPADVQVEADGAIVMDAGTGTVLYGKNMQETYFPASITKILTALVVIENCDDLDEIVTFSYGAVFNVEEGSSNMGVQVGDQLSVRDCLYGLLLASANECANALAEHVAGSSDEFVAMMNEKAASLGCTNSHFANPSGLNNENHYTTAYDMALITRAAIQNETFIEIDGATAWTHGPIKRYPDPAAPENTVYAHHRMLRRNTSVFYPGAFAGKTGYTTLAGNTLVTCAERGGMSLIAVVLNGHNTHYADTKKLLDFGFNNFQTLKIADFETGFDSLKNNLTIAGLPATRLSDLLVNPEAVVVLPKDAAFSDTVSHISYDLTEDEPLLAIAKLHYIYMDHSVGSAYLINAVPETTKEDLENIALPDLQSFPELSADADAAHTAENPGESAADAARHSRLLLPAIKIPTKILIIGATAILVIAAVLGAVYMVETSRQRELERRERLRDKRKMRLKELGFSTDDFHSLMQQKHRTDDADSPPAPARPAVHTSHKRRRRRGKK